MKCQYCREQVSFSAVICPHCRSDLTGNNPPRPHNWKEYEHLAIGKGYKKDTEKLCKKCKCIVSEYDKTCRHCGKHIPDAKPEPAPYIDIVAVCIKFLGLTAFSFIFIFYILLIFFNDVPDIIISGIFIGCMVFAGFGVKRIPDF